MSNAVLPTSKLTDYCCFSQGRAHLFVPDLHAIKYVNDPSVVNQYDPQMFLLEL